MTGRGGRVAQGIGFLGGIVFGGAAMAQPDLYLKGSLSLAEVRDDNLFYTPESRESDVISRLTPGIEAGSRAPRFDIAGRWALDVERFADHPELDTDRARESAALDLHTRLSRPVTFSLHGDYVSTLTPGELNLATGLAGGRARARRFSASPSIAWKLGRATDGTFAYARTKDDLAGGSRTDTRSSTLGLEHHHSPRDTMTADYGFSRYAFEGSGPVAVHTLTLGWERRVGPRSSFALRAGPRYSGGRFDPEASVALQHGAGRIDTSLTVARTLSTVIGQSGTFVTDSALAGISFRPSPSLRLGMTPGVYWIGDPSGGPETRVYAVGIEGSWRINDWLSLVGRYRRNQQRGILVSSTTGTGDSVQEIARDTFFLGLTAGRSETRPPAAAGASAEGSR
ncbi:MAG TPA: hypothetical protein VEW47_17790 [Candidatus Dormibacteraeota bacterium]|nr:hypothetical protein [Candidatus Dormibacteraeota bacterium]